MKKALKIIGLLLGAVILLVVLAALFINMRGIPTYEVQAPDLKVEPDSTHIARGEKLAAMICADCHRGENGKLDGRRLTDIPEEFGTIYSSNVTHHPEYGIGQYTDGELAYLLRTGIKRNGEYAPPYMPKFPHLSDEDLYSVIAYLRSDARPVQASDKPSVPSQPSFLVKFLSNTAFKPLPYPETEIKAPPMSDKVAYGRYLATGAVECYSCHSANFTSNNVMEPEQSVGFMGGGNKLLDLEGNPVLSANLTMHPGKGIGSWTEEQFIQAVRFGQHPDGGVLSSAMPKFSAMTDEEVSMIWAWLQTVPVQDNEVMRAGR